MPPGLGRLLAKGHDAAQKLDLDLSHTPKEETRFGYYKLAVMDINKVLGSLDKNPDAQLLIDFAKKNNAVIPISHHWYKGPSPMVEGKGHEFAIAIGKDGPGIYSCRAAIGANNNLWEKCGNLTHLFMGLAIRAAVKEGCNDAHTVLSYIASAAKEVRTALNSLPLSS